MMAFGMLTFFVSYSFLLLWADYHKLVRYREFHFVKLFATNSLEAISKHIKLNQTYPWGTDSGDAFGDGEGFDGDGVGNNVSDQENYPYN
ncbi:hypothetical protein GUITHDRAFT_102322 [Guillardia theta CCMP2712]|uniref:Uncharacterized protein n=1 Tax=Guillardia theta (strain CCMP2712) TaxID=905079 RepID=L1JTG1_GUITC|nr:hypothetical protein GUITHDRAFT_102322 [Guillardia theta CCMP2712]EKX51717.1 hypothetical protein GUITHDRAFT_102322 [Guillardia theta CCMP2712]|eukprot:XP_005838697.1 hypothetical protein GUITHDRAFT_102322 [Guillardia theta CCMP2712]